MMRRKKRDDHWAVRALLRSMGTPLDHHAVEAEALLFAPDGPERDLVVRLCREIGAARWARVSERPEDAVNGAQPPRTEL